MITSDLNLLREKEPATWEKIARGLPMIPHHTYYTYDVVNGTKTAHQDDRAWIPFNELPPEVALAWLQAVLQDAIQTKIDYTAQRIKHTWSYSIICDLDGIVAWVHASDEEYIGVGDSPAEALLAAYLEAIR